MIFLDHVAVDDTTRHGPGGFVWANLERMCMRANYHLRRRRRLAFLEQSGNLL